MTRSRDVGVCQSCGVSGVARTKAEMPQGRERWDCEMCARATPMFGTASQETWAIITGFTILARELAGIRRALRRKKR